MARFRWFIAGAAAATSALVSVPSAYQRLREAVGRGPRAQLPPGDWPGRDEPAATTTTPWPEKEMAEPPDRTMARTDVVSAQPAVDDEDARELRRRIEETRARIQKRAHEVSSPDGGS